MKTPLRLVAAALAAGLLAFPAVPGTAAPGGPDVGPGSGSSAGVTAGGPNLAAGKPVSASGSVGSQPVGNVNDGNPGTYWESTDNAFPQWAQVDLGASTSIDQVVLELPPAGWQARTQTIAVQGSPDGTSFTTLSASAARAFDPASGNSVTIGFAAAATRFVRVAVTANTAWPAAQLGELEVYGAAGSSGNLASGRAMSASSISQNYVSSNANDGQQNTYWESANNAFPQWLQVDLGSAVPVDRVVVKTPNAAGWGARTQTFAVRGSTDGSTFTDIVAPAAHVFDPARGSAVSLAFTRTTTRHVRLHITANTAWPAGQVGELEVYGPGGGDTQAPSAPTNLAYTQPQTGQIRLTWTASTDNVGVTGYDVYANGTLRTSVAGSVLSYTDTQPVGATVSYFVRAKDAAGNQSGNSNTVTRQGSGGDTQPPTAPGSLAYTQPQTGQIRLTWTASTDNVGVTGYDVYANGALRGSVGQGVLTYTDTQPASATVSYFVRARDAAGNRSANSETVTRQGSGGGSNLAVGKEITASGHVHTFVAANANDNDLATYWEANSGAFPNTLTVRLGANASVTSVVVRLNPATEWGQRTQNIQVLGREQSASGYSSLVAAANYTFGPSSGNAVTIPVTATTADVQLRITSNTGAPGGQVAELQVIGTPAPNPDLTVTGVSWAPSSPVETDPITVSATVRNLGPLGAAATNVRIYLGSTLAGSATVAALAAGGTATVPVSVGTRDAGSYALSARVDEANTVIEQNEQNNTFTGGPPLVVTPVQSSDLVASAVTWSPSNPNAGQQVTFSVTIRNQGTIASAAGAHGVTLTLLNASGATVVTRTGSVSGVIAPGATTAPVGLGTWTAVNGRYTVRVTLADDANEIPVKRANNTSTRPLFVGRGANMPYETLEAEDAAIGGGARVVGPNRTIGDLAGEASGRRAVTLNSTGAFVEFTTRASTNTLVARFSIPDAPGGGGIDSTIDVHVNGTFFRALPLTSRHAWLYGNEAAPNNSPSSGPARHIYDEASLLLGQTFPAGTRIKLQKDAANTTSYAIDFVNTEQVAALPNPDPARYAVPNGFTHQAVQDALDRARQDPNLVGVHLPAGTYETSSKFQVYGKAVRIVGAGPWFTQFRAPSGQSETDVGFRADATANGSTFAHFAYFGNYTTRIDGPGKVFDFANVANMTIDDIWNEHMVCLYWGANTDNMVIRNSRIRNMFADAVNMTNGSTGNLVQNNDSRASGDDSFALFSAIDAGGGDVRGNVYENLTSTLTWRAAGVAVYGGFDNVFRNIYIADTLVYSGITISSLDFGYPMNGFGADPPTRFDNISIVRAGGHFWGNQTFPAMWLFSASKVFQGIRVSNVDIVDPTYSGIMFQTQYLGGSPVNPVTDTLFDRVTITGAQRSGDAFDAKSGFAIWANELPEPGQGPAVGQATFTNLVLSNNHVDIRNTTSTFRIIVS